MDLLSAQKKYVGMTAHFTEDIENWCTDYIDPGMKAEITRVCGDSYYKDMVKFEFHLTPFYDHNKSCEIDNHELEDEEGVKEVTATEAGFVLDRESLIFSPDELDSLPFYLSERNSFYSRKDTESLYGDFVDGITSNWSKNDEDFIRRLSFLSSEGVPVARLTTACIGLSSEGGELLDLWKKVLFHGKEFTQEVREKMIKELGDIFWYAQNACLALKTNREEVLGRNMAKLTDRYPEGFSKEKSDNRQEN